MVDEPIFPARQHRPVKPGVFGVWDAPVTDDAEVIDTPIGIPCAWCQEAIREGDNGRVTPIGYIEHRECSLRNVLGGIGHLVDHSRYCHGVGPDAGLTRRQSALLVWEFFDQTNSRASSWLDLRWKEKLEQIVRANVGTGGQ